VNDDGPDRRCVRAGWGPVGGCCPACDGVLGNGSGICGRLADYDDGVRFVSPWAYRGWSWRREASGREWVLAAVGSA
jgi:hypothetical protein